MDMTAGSWERITPKKAEQYLNENKCNRTLKPGVVEKYAADMKAGKWSRNPQPIIFYDDHTIADGQHRLYAIIESGATLPFVVCRDVDHSVGLDIDTGIPRSLVDNARIAGWDRPISNALIAMVIMVHYGKRNQGRPLSNSERLALIDKYEAHVVWADSVRPRTARVCNAVVGAALARAHMHESNLERLAEFAAVLGGKMPAEGDTAAHAFRTYLLTNDDLTRDARDLFLKAMNAIRYFMRRKSLTVIKGVKEEAYPLKGEKLAKAA